MLIANSSDLMGPDWTFLDDIWPHDSILWKHISGQPQNNFERKITRPNIGRYRAALQATRLVRETSEPALLVSHLPRMTAATNVLRRMLCPRVPHIGFAFNFTDLPTGIDLTYLKWALKDIDRLVVFSTMERTLYSNLFNLQEDQISMLHWAMERPTPAKTTHLHPGKEYFCAIGGEGRDYQLLARVLHKMPDLHVVVVTRPHCLKNVQFPKNVSVYTNLPAPQTWKLATESKGLIVPLKTENTACGHITIVGAQLLGIPMFVTRSTGVKDYVTDELAWMMKAQDADDLHKVLLESTDNPRETEKRMINARITAEARSNPQRWVEFFGQIAQSYEKRLDRI